MAQKAKQWSFPDLTPRTQAELRRVTNAMWALGSAEVATDSTSSPTTTSTSWTAIDATELAIKTVPVRGKIFACFSGSFFNSGSGNNTFIGLRTGTAGTPANANIRQMQQETANKPQVMHVQALFEDLAPSSEVTVQVVWMVSAGTATAASYYRNLIVLQA